MTDESTFSCDGCDREKWPISQSFCAPVNKMLCIQCAQDRYWNMYQALRQIAQLIDRDRKDKLGLRDSLRAVRRVLIENGVVKPKG